jgi:hypothetical protein
VHYVRERALGGKMSIEMESGEPFAPEGLRPAPAFKDKYEEQMSVSRVSTSPYAFLSQNISLAADLRAAAG